MEPNNDDQSASDLAGGVKRAYLTVCPVCGTSLRTIRRHNSFQECKKCGLIKNNGYTPQDYSESYFSTEYQQQYGISYLEDFESIHSAAVQRIHHINSLLKRNNMKAESVCDIGCAYGFFLKACQNFLNCTVECLFQGIEVSAHAAQYTRNSFGFTVIEKDFENENVNNCFTVVSAWFSLEHMSNPFRAIQKISHMLQPGGVAAFSFPSSFGPTRCINPDLFFSQHPPDHSYDFSPSSLRRYLKKSGFGKIIIRPASIHPERVIGKESLLYTIFVPLYRLFSLFAGFSDTVEVYAVKI